MEWKKKYWLGAGMLTLLSALLMVLYSQSQTGAAASSINPYPTPQVIYRPVYEGLPAETFKALPPFPFLKGELTDFYAVKADFQSGRIPLSKIDKDYYLQPEFYDGFERNGVPLMVNYPTYEAATYGIAVYPSEYVAIISADGQFPVDFLIRSDWGVVNFQGIRLVPLYSADATMEENSFPDGTRNITQDIAYVQGHLKIASIEPKEFLLEPAYLRYDLSWDERGRLIPERTTPHFSHGWAKRIRVVFESKGLEAGKYQIGIDLAAPSDVQNEEWFWEYRGLYQVGSAYSLGKAWFNLYVVRN
jgi:hypothetical protein